MQTIKDKLHVGGGHKKDEVQTGGYEEPQPQSNIPTPVTPPGARAMAEPKKKEGVMGKIKNKMKGKKDKTKGKARGKDGSSPSSSSSESDGEGNRRMNKKNVV